jgi:hypothetical protein
MWMLAGFDRDVLEITVSGTSRVRLADVVVHESTVWRPDHFARRAGIPVTSVARTLCDVTAVAPAPAVERAVDDALRRKLVTLRSLQRVADSLDGRGRRRCTVTRGILAERQPGYDPGGSDAELRIVRLLVRAGLSRPVQQWRVRFEGGSARTDLACPELGIVIEYDGWDTHKLRTAFKGDRHRGNDLELLELTVLRFTSASTDEYIVSTVRRAYERALSSSHGRRARGGRRPTARESRQVGLDASQPIPRDEGARRPPDLHAGSSRARGGSALFGEHGTRGADCCEPSRSVADGPSPVWPTSPSTRSQIRH